MAANKNIIYGIITNLPVIKAYTAKTIESSPKTLFNIFNKELPPLLITNM